MSAVNFPIARGRQWHSAQRLQVAQPVIVRTRGGVLGVVQSVIRDDLGRYAYRVICDGVRDEAGRVVRDDPLTHCTVGADEIEAVV